MALLYFPIVDMCSFQFLMSFGLDCLYAFLISNANVDSVIFDAGVASRGILSVYSDPVVVVIYIRLVVFVANFSL